MNLVGRAAKNPMLYLGRALNVRYLQVKWIQACDDRLARRGLERLRRYHATGQGSFDADRRKLLGRILEYAGRRVPYYRDLFGRVGFKPTELDGFGDLPLLDKRTIREQRLQLMSDEIENLPHGKLNTGGSTGEPLEFVTSGVTERAHQEFLFRTMGWVKGDLIVALDGTQIGADQRDNGVFWVTKSRTDLPYGRIAFSSLYLNDETIPMYAEQLIALKPRILRGYPSFVSELAAYVRRNRLESRFRLKGIQLTSENAFEDQVCTIRAAFNAPTFFEYGHSEGCVFAYTLDDTRVYHCSPFYGFIEVVDPGGRPVSIGEEGEVVATGFGNFAMPLIRYRTGDIAVFGGEDRGIVRLTQIVGRTQDFVFDPDKRRVALTALIFGCHYHAFANIRRWQIVQDRPGTATIRIVRADTYSTMDEHEIQTSFLQTARINATIEYVDEIPPTPRGKSRLLIQNVGAA